jgi:hypothetical protein
MKLDIPANCHRRLHFFGFPLSTDWLMDYARRFAPPEKLPGADQTALLIFGLRCLRIHSGIIDLAVEPARFDPSKVSVPDDCLDGPGLVCVLCLVRSDWESYSRRPIQANVDLLKKLLETDEAPRWWEDIHPSSFYE